MKNLTRGILSHITGEHREKHRCWFLIFALIKGINDDEGWDFYCLKWANNECLHLGTKRPMPNSRVGLQDLEQLFSEQGVLICKLKCKCWEDCLKVAFVFKISGAEETCTKLSLCKGNLSKCLGNG